MIQTTCKVSVLPTITSLSHILTCRLKTKRLGEKYSQAISQADIPVSAVPEFKISSFPSQPPRATMTERATFPCMTEAILVQKQI